MKRGRFFAMLFLAGLWLTWDTSPGWTQSTPPDKGQTESKAAKGAQEPARMESERKKGEVEMEARGAQKPGRMETPGAHIPEAESNPGEKWTKHDIQKAQEALKSKGHDPGSIDGVMGPQTRQAIKAFQSANGLKETGSLDAETAKKLGVDRGAGSAKAARSRESSKSPEAPAGK